MYERYFTSKDKEFSKFLSKDWAGEELDGADRWRVLVNTVLVDIFDTYEKVQNGFVDNSLGYANAHAVRNHESSSSQKHLEILERHQIERIHRLV